MNLLIILLIVLLLFGGGGYYGYNTGWYPGYHYMGGIGFVLVILLILFLVGVFRL